MFFANDFTGLLSAPNYLQDVYELEKLTGQFAGNYTKNIRKKKSRINII